MTRRRTGYGRFGFHVEAHGHDSRDGLMQRLVLIDPRTGEEVDLGPVRMDCMAVTATMAASSPAPTQTFKLDSKHGFLVLSMRHVATSNSYNVRFLQRDFGTQRPWQNAAIPASLFFGTGRQPFYLWRPEGFGPGPQLLPPDCLLDVDCTDTSAAPNTALIVLEGMWIDASRADLKAISRLSSETLFVMVKALAVPAGAGIRIEPPAEIAIDGDAPLTLHYIQSSVLTGWNLNFATTDRRTWWENDIPIECIGGDGTLQGGTLTPKAIDPGSTVQVMGQNRTAGALAPTLALVCSKPWRAS